MPNSETKAALRTFYREKSYALINLAGLSLAVTCFLILALYLRTELTYDRHHIRHNEIFRIVNEFTTSGTADSLAVTSVPLGPMLKDNYPEIRDYVRFQPAFQKVMIRSGDTAFYWDDVYSTDENVFEIFSHEVVYGDPQTALKDLSSAAVSETFARKYFGDVNPIGKTIQTEASATIDATPRKITLVFRDFPENTHLKYDVLFRSRDLPPTINPRNLLFGVSTYTYLLMPENYNAGDFKVISDSFYSRFMEDRGKATNMTWRGWLQPLADIHLHSDLQYDLPTGNIYYIYGFAAVAVFILLVACINYVNLAIARAIRRGKEIGMRKILGASRSSLISRFLGEAVLFSVIAVAVGIGLVELTFKLIPINELLGKTLVLDFMHEPTLLLWMIGLSLLIGFISGLYPAAYLSSLPPLSALVSSHTGKKGSLRLRELLVLIQFTVSVIVISCTLIMALQMRYVSNKPLGFEKHNRIIINMRGLDVVEKYSVMKNELLQDSRILGVSASSAMISIDQALPLNAGMVDNRDGVQETYGMSHLQVAGDFLEVMGMQMSSGRDFSKRLLTDIGTTFVVNETMVKDRGWKDPLGKRINLGQFNGRVIGVVKDFHFKSLHNPVESFAMYQFNDNFENIPAEARAAVQRVLIVKVADTDIPQTLAFLQKKLSEYDPKHPFEYSFLDDSVDALYMAEDRLMKMTGIFSGICIFISCLGLFGLASFMTEQRRKEIGIRKVLGASAFQIIVMLARKILWLVLAGALVAAVIAYYATDEWMAGFAYRAGIQTWVFLVAAAVVLAVAFVTVALQSYRTARTNPADTIHYE